MVGELMNLTMVRKEKEYVNKMGKGRTSGTREGTSPQVLETVKEQEGIRNNFASVSSPTGGDGQIP